MFDADRLTPTIGGWVEAALADIREGHEGQLRRFLREVGGDLTGGPGAFVPLCRFYQLMPSFQDREGSISEAVELLETAFDKASASVLRAMLVAAVAEHSAVIGPNAMKFLLSHLDLLDADRLREIAGALGAALWVQSPEALMTLLDDTEPRRSVGELRMPVRRVR